MVTPLLQQIESEKIKPGVCLERTRRIFDYTKNILVHPKIDHIELMNSQIIEAAGKYKISLLV